MWHQIESFMNIHHQPRLRTAWWTALWLLCGTAALAQDDNAPHGAEIPNSMDLHTWFVIIVVGAFLAWSISYSLQLQKEALKKRTSREGLLLLKNRYLDEIAELEAQKEAGTVSEQRFKRQFNNTKLRLAKVLGQIEQNRNASQVD
jgi:hypothetical protein